MKKSSFFILLSMIALSCEFGLTACSSSNEEAVDNPNYDPLTKTVNAKFVFSVSTGNTSSATRQSSASTQATSREVFRGIDEAQLHAFGLVDNGQYVTSPMTANATYPLGLILDSEALDPDGNGLDAQGEGVPLSHKVLELALPTGTNTLMFWGKAKKEKTSAEEGEIDFEASSANLANHAFSLTPRIQKSSTSYTGQDAFLQYQDLISKVLTIIAQTKLSNVDVSYGSETKHVASLSWSDYADLTKSPMERKASDPFSGASMSAQGVVLGNAFAVFHSVADGEIRAGSGPAVAAMISDLYEYINSVAKANPMSISDAVAQAVGLAIKENIENFFNVTSTTASWLSAEQVFAKTGLDKTAVNLVLADASADFNVYPSNFGVPMGVVQLAFSPSKCEWSFQQANSHSMIGTGAAASVFDYMYPAELCYFGNSPVRVSESEMSPSQYPDGIVAWTNDNSWTNWSKSAKVLSSTHSVAMQENINYGTALLESTVRYGSSVLEDNNHAVQKLKNPALSESDEPNNTIQPTASSFKLTGIIIGGQPQTVGWDYLAKAGSSSSFNYIIYDNCLPDGSIPTYTASGNKSTPNYTLVWDNWSEALRDQDQSEVYIALEFVNNTGKAFYGKDNKIPDGGTFYIVGKLDPDKKPADMKTVTDDAYKSDKSLGITWPSLYALPPYDSKGNTLKQRRIFMQDYMTVANFVLDRHSLQNAYVTVPDLRALQISLGLSVDLEWQTGLTFDVILGQ